VLVDELQKLLELFSTEDDNQILTPGELSSEVGDISVEPIGVEMEVSSVHFFFIVCQIL